MSSDALLITDDFHGDNLWWQLRSHDFRIDEIWIFANTDAPVLTLTRDQSRRRTRRAADWALVKATPLLLQGSVTLVADFDWYE